MLGNTYFTSQNGVLKSTSPSAAFTQAGIPRGLDLVLALSAAGTPVMLANGFQVGYRVCWGIRDGNNNLSIGAPSGRFVLSNTAGATRDGSLTFQVPPEVTTSHIYQVYRTTQIANGTDPGDVEQLIIENNPTSAQVAAGSVTVVDIVPDVFRATPLHSNATRDGAGQTNDRPPYCRDISRQGDMVLFWNTKRKQFFNGQLLGVASLTNAVSTITLGGVVYTCNAAEAIATGTFQKFTAGTDTQNTENTAKSLVKVINQYAANTLLNAYYISGPDDAPGMIMLEARSFNVAQFFPTVNSTTTGGAFNPVLPTAASTAVASSDDNRPNRFLAAKLGQPEHVPSENFNDVGGADEEIQRGIQLRDWNCCIKDRSIWKVTGNTPATLSVYPLDNTVAIVGRDTAVALNNQVVCLTNQGVVAISDSGVTIISRQIEADLLADVRASIAAGTQHDWSAVAHESDRSYRLWGPTYQYGDEAGKRVCWKYNTITRAWTKEITNANCAAVVNDRVLYGLNNAFGHVLQQRVGYADATASIKSMIEAADPEGSVVLTGAAGLTASYVFTDGVNWNGYYGTFGPGWVVVDGANWFVVESVNGGVVTFDRTGITNGTKTAYRPIDMKVEFCPRTTGQNFSEKQLGDAQLVVEMQNGYKVEWAFLNETDTKGDPFDQEYSPTPQTHTQLIGDSIGPTALVVPNKRLRTEVLRARARGAQIGVRIRHNVALSRFGIRSVGIETRRTDEAKTTR